MVHPKVRLGVSQQHGVDSDDTRQLVQAKQGDGNANVGQEDEKGLAGAENSAARREVASTQESANFLLALAAGGSVQDQVCPPAEDLVADQSDDLVNGGILKHLKDGQSPLHVLGLRLGHKGHVLFHVARVHVMAVVRELPREERHTQSGVGEEARDVVELGVQREGTVAGLVAQDPEANTEETLNETIDDPSNGPDGGIRDGWDIGNGSPAKRSNHENIAHQIAHGDGDGGLEAVGGDGSPDGVDIREARLFLGQGADHGGRRPDGPLGGGCNSGHRCRRMMMLPGDGDGEEGSRR